MKKPNEVHDSRCGTIRPGDDAGRQVAVERAQAELIDMLARFVLADVETKAAATPSETLRAAHVQRSHHA
jgi:hypothetical protein